MFKKLGLLFFWFPASLVLFIFASFTLYQHQEIKNFINSTSSLVADQSASNNHLDGDVLGVQITDMRPYLVANFLKGKPLEPHSQYIIEVSDKYGIDFRLIPAIAMKESGAGSAGKVGSYNAWGFENGKTSFTSWEEAIDKVGKTLKERYIAKGMVTPEQIMPVYAPPQILTGGKWAKDVNHFFTKMESL